MPAFLISELDCHLSRCTTRRIRPMRYTHRRGFLGFLAQASSSSRADSSRVATHWQHHAQACNAGWNDRCVFVIGTMRGLARDSCSDVQR